MKSTFNEVKSTVPVSGEEQAECLDVRFVRSALGMGYNSHAYTPLMRTRQFNLTGREARKCSRPTCSGRERVNGI